MTAVLISRTSLLVRSLLAGAFLLIWGGPVAALAQPDTTQIDETTDPLVETDTVKKDVPFVATERRVARRMLELAGVTEEDVVYDLGSGDGRIPIIAAKTFGARGVGIEIDPELVAKSRKQARAAGVADQVEFRRKDLFKTDLSDATVVTLYLWPRINLKLRPQLLRELDPGDRIVSHDFRMGDWKPDRTVKAGKDKTGTATLYLWTVPKEIPSRLLETADEMP
ncbi:MAG: cyclopropane-fatty-acyl-phospholipid synthase family protein [Salinibacter sp.]